jgi:hypothetical protein
MSDFPTIPPMPGYQKHTSAETDDQRLRRECVEWIQAKLMITNGHASVEEAASIMDYCFGIALKLLNRNPGSLK